MKILSAEEIRLAHVKKHGDIHIREFREEGIVVTIPSITLQLSSLEKRRLSRKKSSIKRKEKEKELVVQKLLEECRSIVPTTTLEDYIKSHYKKTRKVTISAEKRYNSEFHNRKDRLPVIEKLLEECRKVTPSITWEDYIRQHTKKHTNSNRTKSVIIDGVVYESISKVKEKYDITQHQVTKRCRSKEFPNWMFNEGED